MLQPLGEIREFGIGRPWIPSVPDGLAKNRHMNLVPQMKRHVLQTIEEGTKASSFTWTNACQGTNSLFGLYVVDANRKGKSLVPWVSAGGCNGQRDSMPRREVARLQSFPEPFSIEGCHSPIFDVEDGLSHASVPQFRFCASLKSLPPLVRKGRDFTIPKGALPEKVDEGELNTAQWTLAGLSTESALVEGSQGRVEALSGDLLERVADRPIQRTFQIVATHMPRQAQESLPAKFLLELLMNLRPTIRQA